ncbi:Transposable element Tc3 transposase, putative [Perkinsus marinus ATCC 50983]|uniref:Transposable element Tc3 transposase, putative n=1 Tax=Perkinsus marinus (strain ATCC 50983 / TXsc) TaxID=423536 RepID=C5LIB5_PERM5|nr:Transposable element Tc3 transposase, putative [Perkinsus marinus ATCC 50983]EER03531.1 Transposable element Tc3 transposase, putative [Perkinsus marinus ATCC 50983]|eukprot:XP_002771715.1 Transposable element Tc3 transposase, putative [Perkinsus marinus ATCC 50983]
MPQKSLLTDTEKAVVVNRLAEGAKSVEVAKELGRDHRTIKKYLEDPSKVYQRRGGPYEKSVTPREKRKLKREMARTPLATSKELFDAAGVQGAEEHREGLESQPQAFLDEKFSSKTHKEKRVRWAKDNMKTDFSKVLWTDESRATLDGPDGWVRGWIMDRTACPSRSKRQQGGGGVMIWAGIIEGKVVGPVRVQQGVKMNSQE